jgi:hypothetical protein
LPPRRILRASLGGLLFTEEGGVTVQKFELLQAHPHRFYTTAQIAGYAWSDAAPMPEEVHNYVTRVRRILARLEIPL